MRGDVVRKIALAVCLTMFLGLFSSCFSSDDSGELELEIRPRVHHQTVHRDWVIKTDGSVWAWLSENSTWPFGASEYDFIPVQITEDTVSLSRAHGADLILQEDGTLWWFRRSAQQVNLSGEGPLITREDIWLMISENVCAINGEAVLLKDGSLHIIDFPSSLINREQNLEDLQNDPFAYLEHVLDGVVQFASHNDILLILREDGSLWGSGWNNSLGELGLGHDRRIPITEPERIPVDNVQNFWLEGHEIYLLDSSGTLWGSGLYGIAYGEDGFDLTFMFEPLLENVVDLAASESHTMAITAEGDLLAWRSNLYGELGIGRDETDWVFFLGAQWVGRYVSGEYEDFVFESPAFVMDQVVKVYTAPMRTAAIREDGSLWIWGSAHGDPHPYWEDHVSNDYPRKIAENVHSVYFDGGGVLILKNDGTLWFWWWYVWGEEELPWLLMDNVRLPY